MLLTTLLASLGFVGAAAHQEATAKPPNVVVLLVDDLGWKDLGCFDSPFYETPNIDALAAGGMRFTQAYAAAPVCSPTRAALMTGKYPARLDTTDYFGAPQPDRFLTAEKGRWAETPLIAAPYVDHLEKSETTLAEALGAAGYRTGFFGKWHLGDEGFWPEQQGFDVNRAGCRWGHPFKGYFSPYGIPTLTDGPEGEYLTDRLADEAVKFIQGAGEDPFLLYLAFYTVHTPLQAPEDRVAYYRRKKQRLGLDARFGEEPPRRVRLNQEHEVYAAMVASLDRAVGRVLSTLDERGLDENTIVLLTSDNGGLSTSEGHPTSNVPLRAGKGWLYEGGIRVPLIVRWPGVVRPGSVSPVPVISNDVYPTVLAMTGLDAKPEQHVDGRSLVPILKEEGPLQREALYWHYPHYGNQGGTPGSAIRVGRYKLIELFTDGRLELYDLDQDVGERENLVEQRPELAQELHERLKTWRETVGAKLPTRRDQ